MTSSARRRGTRVAKLGDHAVDVQDPERLEDGERDGIGRARLTGTVQSRHEVGHRPAPVAQLHQPPNQGADLDRIRPMRRMQHVAVHESRLGIPLLFAGDVIHGFRTIFPVPLAEAAAFDPDLARRTARAAAEEATAVGLSWNFAPMVDVSRDARWGRGVEGAGEDVLLGSMLAAARVEGFQGAGLGDPASMLATPKHLAAYGAAAGGLASADANDDVEEDGAEEDDADDDDGDLDDDDDDGFDFEDEDDLDDEENEDEAS